MKITGANSLTFTRIIEHAKQIKGLHIVGIIDCHSPEVLDEMEAKVESGELVEAEGGGLRQEDFLVLLGSELEIYDEGCLGPIHVLCFLPTMKAMRQFSEWLSSYLKNIHLSSQRIYATGKQLQEKVKSLGGLFIPAHVFTPFKSLYGKGVKSSLAEVFDPKRIDAIELGLSADTVMADHIAELHDYTYLSNSDAHSLGKIAREYQIFELRELSFKHVAEALLKVNQQKIVANYGLDPLLGKYHQTVCADCFERVTQDRCPHCGHQRIIQGVADRIQALSTPGVIPPVRPPYIHQIPLEFIPGIGPKSFEKLLDHFGTEMNILHRVPKESLREVIPDKLADAIILARNGELTVKAGGGGKYGSIMAKDR